MLALGGVLAAAATAGAEWEALTGEPAPPFKVERWIHPPDGDNLEDLRGKVVLVEFWATW
jgi:hypothetical protein